MRRAIAPLAPGGHYGLSDGPTRPAVPLGSRLGGQGGLRPLADGSGLGKAHRLGSNPRPVRLPAAPALSLPSLSESIPASFSVASESPDNVLADLMGALYRERIAQPRHWEPGKNLLKVATDGLEEWSHRRGRLGTQPLRALGCLELHVAADIHHVCGQSKGDWYANPNECGWKAVGDLVEHRPIAALALDISGQTAYARALKPWADEIQKGFGKDIAASFAGLANRAVEEIEGWGPGYAYERAIGWDEDFDEDQAEEENLERYLTSFSRDLPDYATGYAYKRTHLARLEAERGLMGALGEALSDLARAIPRPWRKRVPENYLDARFWGENHAQSFQAHPFPTCAFCWSSDTLPDGGLDIVSRIFDDDFEMIQNSETVPFFWLYAFDPRREGDGPGTLAFALEILDRQLRLIRAMDRLLVLLDESPVQTTRMRIRV